MEQLGIFPQYDPNRLAKPTSATLHQFENALENLTAAMYWTSIYTQLIVSPPADFASTATNVQSGPWIKRANGVNMDFPVFHGSARITRTDTHLKVCVSFFYR